MTHLKKLLVLLTYLSLIFPEIQSQKVISVKVKLPKDIDYEKLQVSFENGYKTKDIKPLKFCKEFVYSDSIYSRFGTLSFIYPDADETNGIPCFDYWVNSTYAEIDFTNRIQDKNPFQQAKLTQALSVNEQGWGELKKTIQPELNTLKMLSKRQFSSPPPQTFLDSIETVSNKITQKQIAYFKKYPTDYYSLWLFKKEFSESRCLPCNVMLDLFEQIFPDTLKSTFEGQSIKNNIKASINTKIGGQAPIFSKNDILGNEIKLGKYKGKFVLIDFWASWCAPCIELIPKIEELNNLYADKGLKTISISIDADKKQFNRALKESNISWTCIHEPEFVKLYALGPIPQIILIDKEGVVLYNLEELGDYDLKKLQIILKERIITQANTLE